MNLSRLFSVDLSHNSFSGLIPSALFSLPSLQQVILHDNLFNGELGGFQNASSSPLRVITLSENNLHGQIPSSLFELTNTTELRLSSNNFSSMGFQNVPSSNLQQLDLDNNNFQGPIPRMIFELTKLLGLSLQSNNFSGNLDIGLFHNFKDLNQLELSYNSFTAIVDNRSGSMSKSFPQLLYLRLRSCHISKFPEALRNQDKMTTLDLSSNRLSGIIPQWIWKVGNGSLSHLNLSHNSLEGFEGPFPSLSTSMEYLDLSFNVLKGTTPIPPPSSSFFSLSNNKFDGEISSLICDATYLEVLDLSDNHFTGLIPQCLGEMSYLLVLNLRRNAFRGPLHQTFKEGCKLERLDVSDNQFEGQMPRSMVNCQNLTVLNLGDNQIQDTFPSWLKNLLNLRILVLRSNKFHGSIAQPLTSQAYFPQLQIIDLSSNHFNGSLPSNLFSSWKAMKDGGSASGFLNISTPYGVYYQDKVILVSKGVELEFVKILIAFTAVDLSHNEFHGDIPNSIGELKSLHVLNMSHNRIEGEIPALLENLRNLESLDLSDNSLSGNVPWQLTKLSFLEVLNLSQNHLTGSIAQGGQFQTFENESFMGNPGLCGHPSSKKCEEDPVSAPPRPPHNRSELHPMWIGFGVGYGAGVRIFFWILVLWRKGRHAFFIFVDRMLLSISSFAALCSLKACPGGRRKRKGRGKRRN